MYLHKVKTSHLEIIVPVAMYEDVSIITDNSYILSFTIRIMDNGIRAFHTLLSFEESNHAVYIWEISVNTSQVCCVRLQFHVTYTQIIVVGLIKQLILFIQNIVLKCIEWGDGGGGGVPHISVKMKCLGLEPSASQKIMGESPPPNLLITRMRVLS